MTRFFLVAFLLGLTLSGAVLAADATKPHEHQGKLKPYPRPPPPLKLSDKERARLDEGKPVMRQTEGEAGGRGMAIFRVNANPDVVWATINDFASYPKWIDEVKKCDVYKRDGGKIDVAFQIKSFPVTIDYYIHHDYDMANRWGTWTLDYTRNSDLDDSVGFWRVNPVEGKPDESIVEYSVDIAIKGWVPGFIREMLVDKGLKQATSWVKVQSEKRAAAVK
jgi:ribosome-associated toxin RatA of RatAB toxin-antitoxin module